jgi:cell division septation protein DedD
MSDIHAPNIKYHSPWSGERGSSRRILLLLLVLLLAVFGYLYLFTGLIRTPEEPPKPPAAPASQNKQLLPARPGVKDEKPLAPVSAEAKKPLDSQAKPVPAPAPPVKPATEPVAAAKPAQKEASPPATVQRGVYTLLVGDFALPRSVKDAMEKLRKAAIAPVMKKSIKQQEPMNRLFLAEFSDREAAEVELKGLGKLTADAFILPENGKYAVYAGSYFINGQAAGEQDRLYDKGVKLVMKKVVVPINVTRMTAGSFATRDEALKAAASLKKLGLTAQVVKAGK